MILLITEANQEELLCAQLVRNQPPVWGASVRSLVKITWRSERQPTPVSGLENYMDSIVHGNYKEPDTTDGLSLSNQKEVESLYFQTLENTVNEKHTSNSSRTKVFIY